VLETKAALVNAVVEGEALGGELSGDVLDELQRALLAISPGLADTSNLAEDEDLIEKLLCQAAAEVRAAGPSDPHRAGASQHPSDVASLRKALEGLLRVLAAGSPSKRYRVASTSQAGETYDIGATDADVTCSCPGFEYRGQCRHAREVKAVLAAGKPLPVCYQEVR
jgi:hypothetical protein